MSLNISCFPKCYAVAVEGNSVFGADNRVGFLWPAYSVTILHNGDQDIVCRFNDDEDASFLLRSDMGYTFVDEFTVTSIDFEHVGSGATTQDITIICGHGTY